MKAHRWPAGVRPLSGSEQRAARRRGLTDLEYRLAREAGLLSCLECRCWYREEDRGASARYCAPCERRYISERKRGQAS